MVSKAYCSWRLGPQSVSGSRRVRVCLRRRGFPHLRQMAVKPGSLPSASWEGLAAPQSRLLHGRARFPQAAALGDLPSPRLLSSGAQKWATRKDTHCPLSYRGTTLKRRPSPAPNPNPNPVLIHLVLCVAPHSPVPATWGVSALRSHSPHVPQACPRLFSAVCPWGDRLVQALPVFWTPRWHAHLPFPQDRWFAFRGSRRHAAGSCGRAEDEQDQEEGQSRSLPPALHPPAPTGEWDAGVCRRGNAVTGNKPRAPQGSHRHSWCGLSRQRDLRTLAFVYFLANLCALLGDLHTFLLNDRKENSDIGHQQIWKALSSLPGTEVLTTLKTAGWSPAHPREFQDGPPDSGTPVSLSGVGNSVLLSLLWSRKQPNKWLNVFARKYSTLRQQFPNSLQRLDTREHWQPSLLLRRSQDAICYRVHFTVQA